MKKNIKIDIPADMRKTAQDEAAWLLSLPATDRDSNQPFVYKGREMTNLGKLLLGLMNTAQEDPKAAMTMMTLGGVLRDHDSPPTKEELERRERNHKERVKKVDQAVRTITEQLKKAGVYSVGLNTLIKAVATAKVQLERIADRAFDMEPFIVEVSREGASRVKSNPVTDDFMRYSQQVTTLSSQLVHRAIQLSGKADSDAEQELIKTLERLNDVSRFEQLDEEEDE